MEFYNLRCFKPIIIFFMIDSFKNDFLTECSVCRLITATLNVKVDSYFFHFSQMINLMAKEPKSVQYICTVRTQLPCSEVFNLSFINVLNVFYICILHIKENHKCESWIKTTYYHAVPCKTWIKVTVLSY